MRYVLSIFFLFMVAAVPAMAATLHFPTLTSHVVDSAHLLAPSTTASLNQSLMDYENATTNQVVVVTLRSLEGTTIEDYGYQLGRTWQVGQKGKNNGLLLIIAPHERKARIEVGYGLEPIMTDAIASEIVQGIILQQFRNGHLEQGVIDGTKAILSVLGGQPLPGHQPAAASHDQPSPVQTIVILLFLIWIIWFSVRHPLLAWWFLSDVLRSGSSRVGSDWGGGGGGSFGGGGASGSW